VPKCLKKCTKNRLAKVRQKCLQKCTKKFAKVCQTYLQKCTKNVCKSVPKMSSKSAPKIFEKACQNAGKSAPKTSLAKVRQKYNCPEPGEWSFTYLQVVSSFSGAKQVMTSDIIKCTYIPFPVYFHILSSKVMIFGRDFPFQAFA
jgi:hypothetical protein